MVDASRPTSVPSAMAGIVSTYLELGVDLSNLVVALGAGHSEGTELTNAVRSTYLRENADYYLHETVSSLKELQPARSKTHHRAIPGRRASAARLRMWMGANDGWENRVVAPLSQNLSGHLHRITVSGRVAKKIMWSYLGSDFGLPGFRSRLEYSRCPSLKGLFGSYLLYVNGEHVGGMHHRERDLILHGKEDSEDVELAFMKTGDLIFNCPHLAITLGRVDILKNMVEKGVVNANSISFASRSKKIPILWAAYFNSISASCFEYILSLEEVNCDQRSSGMTILNKASTTPLRLGISAYRALAKHRTTDVNAQILNGHTALHNCLDHFGDFPELVNKVRALLEADADPFVRSDVRGLGSVLRMVSLKELCFSEVQFEELNGLFSGVLHRQGSALTLTMPAYLCLWLHQ